VEQDEPKLGQDQKKNIEELVNDVQASYGPTTVNGMNSSALLKNLSEQAGVASVPASVKTGPADHAAALGACRELPVLLHLRLKIPIAAPLTSSLHVPAR
jgi:hypothetical protein